MSTKILIQKNILASLLVGLTGFQGVSAQPAAIPDPSSEQRRQQERERVER